MKNIISYVEFDDLLMLGLMFKENYVKVVW